MDKQGQDNNYKVPSKSSAYIKAPNNIDKNGASPQKSTGGDLRSKGGK